MKTQINQHTPGPWGARKLGPPSHVWQVDHCGGPIAVVTTPQPPFATKGDPARSQANAALIAAAPELLAACRGALNDLEFRANYDESNRLPKLTGQDNFWMRSHIAGTRTVAAEIRAAIVKAEGHA